MKTEWDDTAIAILRQLRREKHSFAQISTMMAKHGYRFTRNACLAKADRLKLSDTVKGPAEPAKAEPVTGKPVNPWRPTAIVDIDKIRADAEGGPLAWEVEGLVTCTPAAGGSYRIEELRHDQCRFAVTGHHDPDHRFCGEPVKEGSPYCAAHHAKCRQPPVMTRAPQERRMPSAPHGVRVPHYRGVWA
jgi:GcrA cell cycle regulator